jgi:hypothetical protein
MRHDANAFRSGGLREAEQPQRIAVGDHLLEPAK